MKPEVKVNISIDVASLESGLAFYQGLFGFEEVARPFPTMAILDAGTTSICVHEKAEGSQSSETSSDTRRYARHWTPVHLDFHVDALTPFVDQVTAAGGVVERLFLAEGPRPVAFCADPFGNGFCIIAQRR